MSRKVPNPPPPKGLIRPLPPPAPPKKMKQKQKTYWCDKTNEDIPNKKVDDFLDEIEKICLKFDFSISHEDNHGGFIIENYDSDNIEWLGWCNLNLK